MKSWEPHECGCGIALRHLMGAPHFGIVWGLDQKDMHAVLMENKEPAHDVYVSKGQEERFFSGKCRNESSEGSS